MKAAEPNSVGRGWVASSTPIASRIFVDLVFSDLDRVGSDWVSMMSMVNVWPYIPPLTTPPAAAAAASAPSSPSPSSSSVTAAMAADGIRR